MNIEILKVVVAPLVTLFFGWMLGRRKVTAETQKHEADTINSLFKALNDSTEKIQELNKLVIKQNEIIVKLNGQNTELSLKVDKQNDIIVKLNGQVTELQLKVDKQNMFIQTLTEREKH